MLPIKVMRRFIAAVISGVVWDSADKSAAATLSNGNLTVATIYDNNMDIGAVRATLARSAGKYYFEVTLDADAFNNGGYEQPFVGLYRASSSLAALAFTGGSTPNAYGFLYAYYAQAIQNGATAPAPSPGQISDYFGILLNNGGSVQPWAQAGAVLGIAVDLTTRRMWFRPNQREFSSMGNPELNQLPHVGSLPSATLMEPAFTGGVGSNAATANFGASPFVYEPPVGYESWDGTQPAPTHPTVTRAGTIPSGITGCTAYWDCTDRTCLFSNTARTAQCSDGQAVVLIRLLNNTGRGFSQYYPRQQTWYEEQSFGGHSGAMHWEGGDSVAQNDGLYMVTLSTEAGILASTFIAAASGIFTLGFRILTPSNKTWAYGNGPSVGDLLFDGQTSMFGLSAYKHPTSPTTKTRLVWWHFHTADGAYREVYADVDIGVALVITFGLRSGLAFIRVNGVQIVSTAVNNYQDRGQPFRLLGAWDVGSITLDHSGGAIYNAAVTDANLLLEEKYIASGMQLSI